MAEEEKGVQYTCHRATGPIDIDGDLDKDAWSQVPRTPRFGDMVSGELTLFDTRAAMQWDDASLYIAFWLEERDVWSTREKPGDTDWMDNTVEVGVVSAGARYDLRINPMNEVFERFYIWKDSYGRGGRYDVPEFDLAVHRPMVLGGDAGPSHPRGMRWAFFHWRFPGLRTAVRVQGTLNQRQDIDRAWTVEMALPWKGMSPLADGPVPSGEGDLWLIGLARCEVIDQRASRWAATWTPYPMGEHDMHAPEQYPTVAFSQNTGP